MTDEEIADSGGFQIARAQGLALFHQVGQLGEGVAEAIAALIRTYAGRASLEELPPITLGGARWDEPWSAIRTLEPCRGDAGPSKEEERQGRSYKSLFLALPDQDWRSPGHEDAHPRTIEGTIAHEIAHLRWWNLDHGLEFDARVLALLHGAQFPPRGGWSSKTLRIVREKRQSAKAWLARVIARHTV